MTNTSYYLFMWNRLYFWAKIHSQLTSWLLSSKIHYCGHTYMALEHAYMTPFRDLSREFGSNFYQNGCFFYLDMPCTKWVQCWVYHMEWVYRLYLFCFMNLSNWCGMQALRTQFFSGIFSKYITYYHMTYILGYIV